MVLLVSVVDYFIKVSLIMYVLIILLISWSLLKTMFSCHAGHDGRVVSFPGYIQFLQGLYTGGTKHITFNTSWDLSTLT